MENQNQNYAHIKGWGIDANPANEPTYPIKKFTGDDHNRLNWPGPSLQPVNVEILRSNERPNMPAVFGTSTPPSGLSGAIRRYAFKFSESSYAHWLPLLIADRVNVVEGIMEDFRRGKIPNIFLEKGCKAEMKYNPKGFAKKVVTGIIVMIAISAIVFRKKKRR